MAKKSTQFNWTDLRKEQLRKAVKSFNAQINKLNKQFGSGGTAPIIPEKRSVKQLTSEITSYNEFRRELSGLSRIKQAKAKDIVEYGSNKILRYEVQEIKRLLKGANKAREVMRDIAGVSSREILTDRENLRERVMPKLEEMTPKQIIAVKNSLYRESLAVGQEERLNRLKDNYIKAITNNFDEEQAAELINKIKNIKPTDFFRYIANDDLPEIEFIYGAEERASRFAQINTALREL